MPTPINRCLARPCRDRHGQTRVQMEVAGCPVKGGILLSAKEYSYLEGVSPYGYSNAVEEEEEASSLARIGLLLSPRTDPGTALLAMTLRSWIVHTSYLSARGMALIS
mmetsp:Transcript_7776/g.24279  ORF Transcript_7776/g.24279 Transcript_7776/m.24279 type:complete len:108 (-) Transcript_7776:2324-2647(-)